MPRFFSLRPCLSLVLIGACLLFFCHSAFGQTRWERGLGVQYTKYWDEHEDFLTGGFNYIIRYHYLRFPKASLTLEARPSIWFYDSEFDWGLHTKYALPVLFGVNLGEFHTSKGDGWRAFLSVGANLWSKKRRRFFEQGGWVYRPGWAAAGGLVFPEANSELGFSYMGDAFHEKAHYLGVHSTFIISTTREEQRPRNFPQLGVRAMMFTHAYRLTGQTSNERTFKTGPYFQHRRNVVESKGGNKSFSISSEFAFLGGARTLELDEGVAFAGTLGVSAELNFGRLASWRSHAPIGGFCSLGTSGALDIFEGSTITAWTVGGGLRFKGVELRCRYFFPTREFVKMMSVGVGWVFNGGAYNTPHGEH